MRGTRLGRLAWRHLRLSRSKCPRPKLKGFRHFSAISILHLARIAVAVKLRGMSAAMQQGGSVGPPNANARQHASHRALPRICVLLAGLWLVPLAHAGAMYRCTGSQGETVYSNERGAYRDCHPVARYGEPAARPRVSRAAPVPKPSFDGVTSGVETSAQALAGAPDPARFASITPTVESTATLLPARPVPAGKPGQWEYQESRDAVAAVAPDAAFGERVLRGAVYKVTQADGSVEYTNLKPAQRSGHVVRQLFTYLATCMACDLHSPIRWGSVRLNLAAYAGTISAASLEYGVNEALLRAIIHAESAFNPRALSIKGAQGLMQLMPATAGDMGVSNAFDAEQNIRGGARYLGLLLKTFGGNEKLAAAAYNAGPAAVQKYGGVPPYAETQVYVQRVATLRTRYGAALHPPLAARSGGRSLLR